MKKHPNDQFADYEIATGKDGKPGIYTRDYNCRLATFNANTFHLQKALGELFERAHRNRVTREAKARRQ